MPGADGHEVLKAVKSYSATTPVVMLTAYATVSDAVAAVKQGAYDYIEKPFDPDDLALIVARAADHRRRALQQAADPSGSGFRKGVSVPYREAVEAARDRASREYLAALMREFHGCVTWAAERAGMDRVSLHRLLRRFGIHSEEFKNTALPGAAGTAVDAGSESPVVRMARALGSISLNGEGQGDRRTAPSKTRPPELPTPTPIPN
jgi:DNA-binding NtrC family response regulator